MFKHTLDIIVFLSGPTIYQSLAVQHYLIAVKMGCGACGCICGTSDVGNRFRYYYEKPDGQYVTKLYPIELVYLSVSEHNYFPDLDSPIKRIKVYFSLLHAFLVIETDTYYYTIERYCDVDMQRSTDLKPLLQYFKRYRRFCPIPCTTWVAAKGTVRQMVLHLVEKGQIGKGFSVFTRNCQTLVATAFIAFRGPRNHICLA